MAKIILIWPPVATNDVLPLSYLHMVPILLGHHTVGVMDMNLPGADIRKVSSLEPDIVGISGWSSQAVETSNILSAVRRYAPKVKTVVGGPHYTMVRDYDPRLIDYAVVGESEHIIVDLVDAIMGDKDTTGIDNVIKVTPDGLIESPGKSEVENLDSMGQPLYGAINLDHHLGRGYKYKDSPWRNAPIMVTRGCPYDCQFCSAGVLAGHKLRKHSYEYILLAMKQLYDIHGVRHFNFVDDNLTFDMSFAKELVGSILANRRLFPGASFATPNGLRADRLDHELLRMMRAAGWYKITIAPETGSPKMMKAMHKGMKLSTIVSAIDMIHDAGLLCEGYFIVGYPGETKETLDETFAFITDNDFDSLGVHRFQPLPGTPIYNQLITDGVIDSTYLPESYNLYDDADGYVPPGWTSEQFKARIARGMEQVGMAKENKILERWNTKG